VPFCTLTATTAFLCIFPPQHYPSLKYNNTTYKVLAAFEYKGNLVNETNLVHYFFLVYFVNFIYNLYMFRASPGPSPGGTTVFMQDTITSTKCYINTVIPPDDGPGEVQNM
jgi:hypothetical protein